MKQIIIANIKNAELLMEQGNALAKQQHWFEDVGIFEHALTQINFSLEMITEVSGHEQDQYRRQLQKLQQMQKVVLHKIINCIYAESMNFGQGMKLERLKAEAQQQRIQLGLHYAGQYLSLDANSFDAKLVQGIQQHLSNALVPASHAVNRYHFTAQMVALYPNHSPEEIAIAEFLSGLKQ